MDANKQCFCTSVHAIVFRSEMILQILLLLVFLLNRIIDPYHPLHMLGTLLVCAIYTRIWTKTLLGENFQDPRPRWTSTSCPQKNRMDSMVYFFSLLLFLFLLFYLFLFLVDVSLLLGSPALSLATVGPGKVPGWVCACLVVTSWTVCWPNQLSFHLVSKCLIFCSCCSSTKCSLFSNYSVLLRTTEVINRWSASTVAH